MRRIVRWAALGLAAALLAALIWTLDLPHWQRLDLDRVSAAAIPVTGKAKDRNQLPPVFTQIYSRYPAAQAKSSGRKIIGRHRGKNCGRISQTQPSAIPSDAIPPQSAHPRVFRQNTRQARLAAIRITVIRPSTIYFPGSFSFPGYRSG